MPRRSKQLCMMSSGFWRGWDKVENVVGTLFPASFGTAVC